MNDLNRDRAIIDLDELERQLREAGSARRTEAAAAPQEDPLAELARIVEQDDPYRQVWSRAARDSRVEPSLGTADEADDPFAEPMHHRRAEPVSGDDPYHMPAEPDDAQWGELRAGSHPRPLLAEAARHESEYRQADSEPEYADEGVLPPHPVAYEQAAEAGGKSRRGLAIAAAVAVLVLGGGAAALMLRGHSGTVMASGEPPVIQADTGPAKIHPENPGGVEVPNQDRQIYERTAEQPAPVKIVGHSEQPVDVAQAPKAEPGRSIIPAPSTEPASTATTPQPSGEPALQRGVDNPVLAALAPRRVKTVSVRPDGTIIDPHSPSINAPASTQVASLADAVPSNVPASTASTGAAPSINSLASGVTPAPAPKPKVQAAPTTTATPVKQAAADPVAAAAPAKPKPAQGARVAAVDPAEATPAAASAPTAAAPSGTFSVQLAAPASEQEARDTASRLGKRFAGELGGLKPGIRQAEVNGRSIWRVRVGAIGRDEATALCTKIQGAGGQCFVAKN
jgi:hypothetical protein